jgi:hypothetical protein
MNRERVRFEVLTAIELFRVLGEEYAGNHENLAGKITH